MSMTGIWSSEIFGLYGWENTGILIFDHGSAIGGGNHHYSEGSYKLSKGRLSLSLTFHYHGHPRTLFGEARKEFSVLFKGEVAEDTEVTGSLFRPERPDMAITCRFKRRAKLSTSSRKRARKCSKQRK